MYSNEEDIQARDADRFEAESRQEDEDRFREED